MRYRERDGLRACVMCYGSRLFVLAFIGQPRLDGGGSGRDEGGAVEMEEGAVEMEEGAVKMEGVLDLTESSGWSSGLTRIVSD